jgi:hypothetical protein
VGVGTDLIGATLEVEFPLSLTLNLPPEAEAELQRRAERSGKSIEEFVIFMAGITPPGEEEKRSPEERAAAFRAWAESHRDTPPLSDYAVSRESMYEGR